MSMDKYMLVTQKEMEGNKRPVLSNQKDTNILFGVSPNYIIEDSQENYTTIESVPVELTQMESERVYDDV